MLDKAGRIKKNLIKFRDYSRKPWWLFLVAFDMFCL